LNTVAPGFFKTWQLPLLRGRDVDWRDRENTQRVVVVNEAFARQFYGDRDPVGQTLGMGAPCDSSRWTVIGLVADSKISMRYAELPTIYIPFRQPPPALPQRTFAVRITTDTRMMWPAIRQVMTELDPNVPIFDALTVRELKDRMMAQEGLLTDLLSLFGLSALLLSGLGIYGTLAYTVARKTPEIGTRMALGAQRADIFRMILRETFVPVSIGVVIGLTAALALTHLIASMLFGVSNFDSWTIVSASALVIVTTAAAASLPATRATRIDPLIALRYE
jgi:predicted permease